MMGRAAVLAVLAVGPLWGCLPELPERLIVSEPLADIGPDNDVPRPDMSPDMGPDAEIPDRGAAVDGPLPMPESCNGEDDDLDGRVDEGFALGMPCTAGQGICAAEGTTVCRADGMGFRCDAVPGRPSTELCNGLDDDCSGVIDEGFEGVDEACTAGEGVCRAEGTLRCSDDGEAVECSVRPVEVNSGLERCNGIDDDCDGAADEALRRGCQAQAIGVCIAGQQICDGGQWSACESVVEPDLERGDLCNGIDDDCDGLLDEDILPPSDEGGCGPLDCIDLDGCIPSTACTEQCDPESEVRTRCARAPEEACDGRDDDCDGAIDDDGICGRPMVETCTFGLGWSLDDIPAPADNWGDCDFGAGGFDDRASCNGTRDDRFVTVQLPEAADVDAADDRLGVTLRCSPGAVGDYIVSHCRIVLGIATAAAGVADSVEAWGACPAARVGGNDSVACTSSTAQGGFEPMPVPFDLTTDQLMAVAFICQDGDDPARAAALQSSLAVSLAWADSTSEGEIDWAATCGTLGDGDPYTACARTRGDGRFRAFQLTADVDGGDRFAIQLSPL